MKQKRKPLAAQGKKTTRPLLPLSDNTLWRNLALCLAGGMLAAFAFPNPLDIQYTWPGGFLAFICLLPLLAIHEPRGPLAAWRWGFVYGLVYFGICLIWIGQIPAMHWMAPFAWLFLIGYLSLFPAVFVVGYQYLLAQKVPYWFAAPTLWVALEYLRNYCLTGFPWGSLGYAFQLYPWMMAMAPVAGIWGLSFAAALVNVLIFGLVKKRLPWLPVYESAPRWTLGMRAGLLAGILLILITGAVVEGRKTDPSLGSGYRVAALQGNVNQDQSWDQPYQIRTLAMFLDLLKRAVDEKAQLAVWPETAFPGIFNLDKHLANEVKDWSKQWSIAQLVGTDDVELAGPDGYDYFNSVIMLGADGKPQGQTSKMHLVPFGEYVPLKHSVLYFIDKLVRRYGGAGFTPGRTRNLLTLQAGVHSITIGALICFESIFPQYAAQLTRQGSQLLVMTTYDTWFGETAAPAQHAVFSAFRAAENARYLVRVGATGISCFFDPRGKMIKCLGLNQPGELTETVYPSTRLTWYTRLGDWLPWICLIAFLLDLLIPVFRNTTFIPQKRR
jgi:apolipoprotein N-acyltransferase